MEEAVARIGRGSYAVKLPPGAKEPQSRIFKTAQFKGPVPTSDWWSSLAWVPFSEAQYAHPLVLRAEKAGLRVYYASAIRADKIGVFGMMAGGQEDVVLGINLAPFYIKIYRLAHHRPKPSREKPVWLRVWIWSKV